MTVTIQVQATGLNQTITGVRRLIALQRELQRVSQQNNRGGAGRGGGLGRQAGQAARLARETVRAEQAARRAEVAAQRSANSFGNFSAAVGGTSQRLTGIQQRLQQYRQANVQLAQSLGLPVASIRTLNTQLGTLPDRTAQVATSYIQLRDAGESNRRIFDSLNSEFGVTQQQFQALEQTIGASTLSLTALATAASGVSTAIAGIFRGGLQDFLAVEGSFNTLQAITGRTREEIAGLEEETVRLGSTTARSNAEVAATAITMIRLGFSAEEAEAALAGVVEGSLASGESLNTIGRITAQVVNQFDDLNAASANAISDTIVATANNSASSVSGLGQALSFVGGEANNLDQSLADVATAVGLIADSGIPAGRAGRNLAQVFIRLNNAAAQNSENFQRLGVSVRDANGEFRPLLDLIPEIRANLDALGDPGQVALLTNRLFGTEGARAFNALIANTDEEIESLRQTITNAAGSSAEAANVLQQGLPGALSRLESATETASAAIGRQLAPAAAALVNSAQALVSGFAALPAPIQGALVSVTAFAGILAAATAAIASYTVASRFLTAEQFRQAAATTATTAATVANTVVTGANAIAQTTLSTALTRVVAGFRASTAAVATNSTAIGSGAVAIGRFAAQIAILVAAIGAVNAAASRFRDGGEDFRDTADEIREGLLDIQVEAEQSRGAIESVIPNEPPPAGFIDGAITQLNRLNSTLNNIFGLPEDFLRIPTAAEESVNDARIASEALSESIFELIDRSQELATGFAGTESELRDAAAIQDLFTQAIASTQARLQALDASELGQDAYIELSGQLRTNITLLERQRDAFNRQIAPAEEAADAIADAFSATQEELQAVGDELERQRDALRSAAEEEFRVQASIETDTQRDRQRAQDLALRRAQQAQDRAAQADQRRRELALTEEINRIEETAEAESAERKLTLERDIQAEIDQAERDRARLRENLENRLNEQRRTFDEQINQRRSAAEDQVARARLEAERGLQLEDAGSRRERRELEARFEQEDEAAERRAEALAPVLELERRLQAEIQADEEAFDLRQAEERVRVESAIEKQKVEIEEGIAIRRQELEAEIALTRQETETQVADLRRTLEAELQQEALVREEEQAAARRTLERAQREENRALEADQRIERQQFEAEQRRLDEESAQEIERLIAGNREEQRQADEVSAERIAEILREFNINAAVPGFKEGGVAPGGVVATGEGGPELGVMPAGTRIFSNQESRAIASQAIQANPALARPFISSSGARSPLAAMAMGAALSSQNDMSRVESLLEQNNSLLNTFQQAMVRDMGAVSRAATRQPLISERLRQQRREPIDPLSFLGVRR